MTLKFLALYGSVRSDRQGIRFARFLERQLGERGHDTTLVRSLLVVGALSVIRRAKQLGYTRHPWLVRLMERRSVKIAAIALANKIARIAWAMMARNESYRTPLPASA